MFYEGVAVLSVVAIRKRPPVNSRACRRREDEPLRRQTRRVPYSRRRDVTALGRKARSLF